MKIAIVTINQPSLDSACKLIPYLDGYEVDIFGKKDLKHNLEKLNIYNKLDDILPTAWRSYDAIIAILAMGAVVRKIAPLLQDKSTDPAVIVINLALDKIVPLLSGHIGGANSLSDILAKRLGAINFISTATDQTNTLAFDSLAIKEDWRIENLKQLANISNRLLNKQTVNVATYKNIFDSLPIKDNLKLIDFNSCDQNSVIIAPNIKTTCLNLKPKIYLGIGCNKDTPFEEINKAILEFLDKHNLDISQIKNIASFEAKKDEQGLLQFAKHYNFDIKFYQKEDINALEQTFSHSASTKFFGLKGVAEPSSLLISKYKELIIKKESFYGSITVAASV